MTKPRRTIEIDPPRMGLLIAGKHAHILSPDRNAGGPGGWIRFLLLLQNAKPVPLRAIEILSGNLRREYHAVASVKEVTPKMRHLAPLSCCTGGSAHLSLPPAPKSLDR